MLDVQGWLACPGCGAWGGREALCRRCGAVRGGRVPLDQSPGDGGWVLAARGGPAEVLRALELRPDVDGDVVERVGAARRVLEGGADPAGAPDLQLALWLDLRPARAGQVARRSRNANVQDTVFVLPWLLLRHGAREARVVRTVHQRVRTGFVRGAGERTTTARLDELHLFGPEGGLRRPLGRLDQLEELDWTALEPDAPEPGPLPATAPGRPGAGGRAPLLTGLLAAAVLLGVCPLLVRPFAPLAPEQVAAARTQALWGLLAAADGPSPAAVDQVTSFGEDARDAVRAAFARPEPWAQVHALVAGAAVFERQERVRRLAQGARRRDGHAQARAVAVDLLAREGDLGGTHLVGLVRAAELEPAARVQALLALLDLDVARAGATALHQVRGLPPATPLRRACLQALGAPGAVGARDRGAALDVLGQAAVRDVDPSCRGRAAWSLAVLAPGERRTQALLLGALGSTLGLSPPREREPRAHQALLARALVRSGLPPSALQGLSRHPGLGEPAATVLARALERTR